MNDIVIIKSSGFNMVSDEDFLEEEFSLIHLRSEEELNSLVGNDNIWKGIGSINKNRLLIGNFFLRKGQLPDGIIGNLTSSFAHRYTSLFRMLWLIRDNSCMVNFCALYQVSTTKLFNYSDKDTYSDASGNFLETAYSMQEVMLAVDYVHTFLKLAPNLPEKYDNEPMPVNVITKNYSYNIPYDEANRIKRAFSFLKTARNNHRLPAKISFYVLVLECLFSTDDSSELSHKISERSAFYIGTTPGDKVNIYKHVKKCYNVRSKYVHGQKLGSKIKETSLSDISIKIDEILRRILVKVITEDGEMFLQDDNKMSEWFLEMMFK